MTLLNDSDYAVVKEYIIFLKDEIVGVFFDENELRAIGNRTNCHVELTNRILNRKIGGFKIVKYAIIQLKGKDNFSIRQCNRLLEQRCPSYRQRQEYNKKSCVLFPEESSPDNASLYFQYQRSGSTTYQFGKVLLKSPYESTVRRPMDMCYWKSNDSDLKKSIVMPCTKQTENYFSRYLKNSIREQEGFDNNPYSCCYFSNSLSGDQLNQAYDECKAINFNDYGKHKNEYIYGKKLRVEQNKETNTDDKKNIELDKIVKLGKNYHSKKQKTGINQVSYAPKINHINQEILKTTSKYNEINTKNNVEISKDKSLTKIDQALDKIIDLNHQEVNEKSTFLNKSLLDFEFVNNSPGSKTRQLINDKTEKESITKTSEYKTQNNEYNSQFIVTTERAEVVLNVSKSQSKDSQNVSPKTEIKIEIIEDIFLLPDKIESTDNLNQNIDELKGSLFDIELENYSPVVGIKYSPKNILEKNVQNDMDKNTVVSNNVFDLDEINLQQPIEIKDLNVDVVNAVHKEHGIIVPEFHINDRYVSTDTHITVAQDPIDTNKHSHSVNTEVFTDSQRNEMIIDNISLKETENRDSKKLITLEIDNINYNDEMPSAIEIKFGIEMINDLNEINNLNVQEFSVANKYDQINYKTTTDPIESKMNISGSERTNYFSPKLITKTNLEQNNISITKEEISMKINPIFNETVMLNPNIRFESQTLTPVTKMQTTDNFDGEITDIINKFLDNNDKCVALQTISTTKEMFILDETDRKNIIQTVEDIKRKSKCETVLHESFYQPTQRTDESINKSSLSNQMNIDQELTFNDDNDFPKNKLPIESIDKTYQKSNESKSTKITTPTFSSLADIQETNDSKRNQIPVNRNIQQEDVRLLLRLPINVQNNKTNEITENFNGANREFQIVYPENIVGTSNKIPTFQIITNNDKSRTVEEKDVSESIIVLSDNKYLANIDFNNDETEINISTSFFKFNASLKESDKRSIQLEMLIKNNFKHEINELSISNAEADIQSPLLEFPQENTDVNYASEYPKKYNSDTNYSTLTKLPLSSSLFTTEIIESPAEILARAVNRSKHNLPKTLINCFSFNKDKKEKDSGKKHDPKKIKSKNKFKCDESDHHNEECKSKFVDCLELPKHKPLSKISEISDDKAPNTNENGIQNNIEFNENTNLQLIEKEKNQPDNVNFDSFFGSTIEKDSDESKLFLDTSTNESLIQIKLETEIISPDIEENQQAKRTYDILYENNFEESIENKSHLDQLINETTAKQEVKSSFDTKFELLEIEERHSAKETLDNLILDKYSIESDKGQVHYDMQPQLMGIYQTTESDLKAEIEMIDVDNIFQTKGTFHSILGNEFDRESDNDFIFSDTSINVKENKTNSKTNYINFAEENQEIEAFKSMFGNTFDINSDYPEVNLGTIPNEDINSKDLTNESVTQLKLFEIDEKQQEYDILNKFMDHSDEQNNYTSINQLDDKQKMETDLNTQKIETLDHGKSTYNSIFENRFESESETDIVHCDTSPNGSYIQQDVENNKNEKMQLSTIEDNQHIKENFNSHLLNPFDMDSDDDNLYFDSSKNISGIQKELENDLNPEKKLLKIEDKQNAKKHINSVFIDTFDNDSVTSTNSVIISDVSNNAEIPADSNQKDWRKQNRNNPAMETLTKLENLSGMDLLVQQMSKKLMIDISCMNDCTNYPEIKPVDSESQSSETLFSLKFEIPIKNNELTENIGNNNFINRNNLELSDYSMSSDISSLTKIPESNLEINQYLFEDVPSLSTESLLNSNFSNSTEYFSELFSKYFDEFNFSPNFRKSNVIPLVEMNNKKLNSNLQFAKLNNENYYFPSLQTIDFNKFKTNVSQCTNHISNTNPNQSYSIDRIYQSEILNRAVEICKLKFPLLRNVNNLQLRNVSSTNINKYCDQKSFIDRFYVPHLRFTAKIISKNPQIQNNIHNLKIIEINLAKHQLLPNFSNKYVCKNFKVNNNISKFQLNDNSKINKLNKKSNFFGPIINNWSNLEFCKIAYQNMKQNYKMINEISDQEETRSSTSYVKLKNTASSIDKEKFINSIQHRNLFANSQNENFEKIKNWILKNNEFTKS